MVITKITPSKVINVAFRQYINNHSDYSVLEVLQNIKHDNLRAKASGFALKEYIRASSKERNISFEVENGSLIFYKNNFKVCTFSPEVTKTISKAYVENNKVNISRGKRVAYTLNESNEDEESLLLRVYSITLLFCYSSIVKGIEDVGLSDVEDIKQITFVI